eukprot:jgi/Galph1/3580/GphlegSOOS_G2202.1
MKAACLQMNVPIDGILNIPSSQYLFLAFDEIGTLEAKTNKYDFGTHPVVGVRPYNNFFGIIRELCEQDNLFFLVVGKSNGLSIQNYATSVSRVLLRFIPLSPLDSPSIKGHLEKSATRLPNKPLASEFLCSASLRVEELADVLLEYTGGVPGLLIRAVNILLNNVEDGKEPLSKEKCIELMENDKFQEFCTKPFESGLSVAEENTRQSLDILLMMALYHIPFRLDRKLPSRASVFDVATEMGFINVLLIGILMLIRYFENLSNISRLGKQLLETLRTEPVDCFYDSKCRLFDGLVVMQLHRILSSNAVNGPFRQLLSQLSPIWRPMKCTMDFESSTCYMKSIHHSEAPSLSKHSSNSFESKEWKKIILESLEYVEIFTTASTGVSDILFKLHSMDLASSLVVGIVCKVRRIELSDIISEAEEFLIPIHDQLLSESLETFHCMLIIVGAKLSSTVATELNYESCCYSSGSLICDTVKIPPNCELVVLSEKDVEMFVRKEILTGLGRTFTMTDKPTLDLIGTDFMQQICSS